MREREEEEKESEEEVKEEEEGAIQISMQRSPYYYLMCVCKK